MSLNPTSEPEPEPDKGPDEGPEEEESTDDEELAQAKNRHPSSIRQVMTVSGVDPDVVPGVWRKSKVDGYAWFEPELFEEP